MRLVSFCTPSHKDMLEEFVMPVAGDFDTVVVGIAPQRCPSAAFKQEGWNECMVDKIDTLLSLPTDDKPTVYVDADVLLTKDSRSWFEAYAKSIDRDSVHYADDSVQWCAGVMVFHATERVAIWWRVVREMSIIWNVQDQDAIHSLRVQSEERGGPLPVNMGVLPGSAVANWATLGNRSVWDGEPFTPPDGFVAWHANWTIGVQRKLEMLRAVAAHVSK